MSKTQFTTSKGSTYTVHRNGTTERNKSLHAGHADNDQGPQKGSETTFYVTQEQIHRLGRFQTACLHAKAISWLPDGSGVGLRYLSGPNAGKWEADTVVRPVLVPAIGLAPVELWWGGRKVHFGNAITKMLKAQ
jgi:hypothetical protein